MTEENIKKSETREFQLYLDAEINRMLSDRSLLHGALEKARDPSCMTNYSIEAFNKRYGGKTSNELKRQVSEDAAELGRVERYLNSLKWVRDLNIDIDLLEETIPGLDVTWHVRDAEENYLNLKIAGEITPTSEALSKFSMFLHNRSVEFKISERVRVGLNDLLRIESGDAHIKWVFKDKSVWLALHGTPTGTPYLTFDTR